MCWCMSRQVNVHRCELSCVGECLGVGVGVGVGEWVQVIRNVKMNVKVSGQGVCECGGDSQDDCECEEVCGCEDECRGESDGNCGIEMVVRLVRHKD